MQHKKIQIDPNHLKSSMPVMRLQGTSPALQGAVGEEDGMCRRLTPPPPGAPPHAGEGATSSAVTGARGPRKRRPPRGGAALPRRARRAIKRLATGSARRGFEVASASPSRRELLYGRRRMLLAWARGYERSVGPPRPPGARAPTAGMVEQPSRAEGAQDVCENGTQRVHRLPHQVVPSQRPSWCRARSGRRPCWA
jgi:hypothetical protein